MRRALGKLALILVIAAPIMVGQTAPTPPPAPPQKPAPAVKPRRPSPQTWSFVGVGGASSSYLGIDPRDITADRVGPLKLKSERGVEVAMVDQDSPAGKAGLKEHDVILTFNGNNVESVEELKRMLRETPPGRTVALGISRDGNPQTLNVQLGDRSKITMRPLVMPDMNIHIPPMPEMPDIPAMMAITSVGRNGIMVESLTAQLGDFFGVKNGQGVLVRSVEKGTPGEAAGLKAGDVIVGAGSERVGDTGDWRRVVRAHPGETVQLHVIRDKREITLPLAIPKRRDTGMLLQPQDWDLDLELQLQDLRPKIEQIKAVEMAQLQRQLALHQKELDRVNQQVRVELERAMRAHQQDMVKTQRALEKAQKELQQKLRERMEQY